VSCFLYLFVNILLICLLYVLLLFRIHICFTLLYYFCCNIVACSLIYSHEILGIWCSISQTANGKSIVRAPGNLSSVSPHFSWGLRPCGLTVNYSKPSPFAGWWEGGVGYLKNSADDKTALCEVKILWQNREPEKRGERGYVSW
jgi:hypothetical protein